jgi:hypothetical protein
VKNTGISIAAAAKGLEAGRNCAALANQHASFSGDAIMAIWNNYHFTNRVDVADARRFNPDGDMQPAPATTGPDMLTTTASLMKLHVAQADQLGTRCGLVGKAWSFSRLTGNGPLQLDCGGKLMWETGLSGNSGLVGMVPVSLDELHPAALGDAGTLAWTRGGTTMRELALWSEAHDLSLITSGDQLGPSLAGAVASGTHGSRLGKGAVQNIVRGMHLVTASDRSIWMEPARKPVLANDVALLFADDVIRDDGLFFDALVHLGAMGIVNGAIVEFERKQLYDRVVPIVTLAPIWDAWLAAVAARDWATVARLLGHDGDPIFYEFSLSPFDPKDAESVHILYFRSHSLLENNGPGRTPRPSDAVYVWAQQQVSEPTLKIQSNLDLPALYVRLVRDELAQHPTQTGLPWSGLHAKDEETGERGALFNAGFAVPFAQLEQTITTMCESVAALKNDRQFIFTFRFVTDAVGTLAHLRWPESVAIELDGASELFANRFGVTQNSNVALKLVQAALDAAGLEYCMHWGKLGNNTQIVARNFGGKAIAGSPIAAWHRTRSELLSTAQGRRTMMNDVVVQYGLV